MNQNLVKKSSENSSVDRISVNGESVIIKRISEIRYGLGQPPQASISGLPLIRATDIKRGKIIPDSVMYVDPSDIPYDRNPILKENEIIVVRSGAYTGDSAIVPKQFVGAVTGYDMVLTIKKANPHYIAYCMLSNEVLEQINQSKLRAAQPHLNAEELGSILVFLPYDRSVQDNFVKFLDRKTRQIDTLIEKKQRLIDLLKEYRTAVINQAVTKGLDPNVKMKDSGIEWLGEIPAHWKLCYLKYLLNLKSGDGIRSDELKDSGAYEVYGGNGFIGYSESSNVSDFTIVVGRVGAKCGNIHLIEGDKWVSDNALIGKTSQSYKYTSYLLNAMNLNNLANQNAQPLITATMIKNQKICLPKMNEQLMIADFLEKKMKVIRILIEKTEHSIRLMKEYRMTLISDAVTGKVDVRDEVTI